MHAFKCPGIHQDDPKGEDIDGEKLVETDLEGGERK